MEPDDPDPTRRFADRAADYARYRPGYPAAAVDIMLGELTPAAGAVALVVADVAAGTGILSRLLADRGAQVLAVEPNAAMRDAAAAHPGVRWIDGTAEASTLADASLDLVTVAQAFHWFDVPKAARELRRVLRPGGRLVVTWNRRNRDDAFTNGYRRALEAIDGDAPAERSAFDPAVVTATGCFVEPVHVRVPNTHELTEEELLGRALSTSTVPKHGPATERLIGMLRELHRAHRDERGVATMRYHTEVHLWRRA